MSAAWSDSTNGASAWSAAHARYAAIANMLAAMICQYLFMLSCFCLVASFRFTAIHSDFDTRRAVPGRMLAENSILRPLIHEIAAGPNYLPPRSDCGTTPQSLSLRGGCESAKTQRVQRRNRR